LLLRIAQGIGLGGEWGGAVLMAYAPKNQQGFYASLPQIGLAIGLFMASGVVALLSWLCTDEQFMAWGWRIAFLISGLMVAGRHVHPPACQGDAGICCRQGAQCGNGDSLFDMMRRYPGNVLKGMGARYIDGVFFNVFGVFSIT
jgi:hypothetical protein